MRNILQQLKRKLPVPLWALPAAFLLGLLIGAVACR